jgi:Protein of unknown function, DUF547
MRKSLIIAFVLMFCGFANAQDYASLLQKHVKPAQKAGISVNLVDYKAWAQDELHEKALNRLLSAKPQSLQGNEKLAFWINAYNLLTVDVIVKTGETKSIRNQGTLMQNVWKKHVWTIGGKNYTLDEIEHGILRTMNAPRIHFAINCASLSCPDLRTKPYSAATLDKELEEATMVFLKDKTKGVVFDGDKMQVSSLFKWFKADFGDVEAFINTRLNSQAKITTYLDYNWNLNGR